MHPARWKQLVGLAQRQHGVVSSSQIQALGYSEQELRTLCRNALISRIEKGVYVLTGHRTNWQTTLMIHCWATRGRAFATSAAMLHRLASPHAISPGYAEVLVPTSRRPRQRARLSIHRSEPWNRVGTIEIERIPVVPLPAALVSLALLHDFETFRNATNAARRQRRISLGQIDATAAPVLEAGGRHCRNLKASLDQLRHEPALSLSDWSDDFADWCTQAGLPSPVLEYRIVDRDGAFIAQVDLCWPDQRLAVELDSWSWHHDHASFNRDRHRSRRLTASGWRVMAITWAQWIHDRDAIARDLAAALDQR